MDASLFGPDKTGQLVKISGPDDWAFIPDPLPPKWEFPHNLWPLLAGAKEAVATLDGIGRHLPNPHLLLKPLQDAEAVKSSTLEGTIVTPQELLLFEMQPREPRSVNDRANDWREVFNYSRALAQGYNKLGEYPLSFRLITEMHRTLLAGARGREKTPGSFRTHQVHIGSGRRYVPPPAPSVMACFADLEKYMNAPSDLDPLVRAYIVHYQFEAIHPFPDGNGRVGRLLLALATYAWCGHAMPWLYMSNFFERYKDEYIDNLFRISTEGRWGKWIEFCLKGTIEQANDSVQRCESLLNLRKDYEARISDGSVRLRNLVDTLFTAPLVNIPDVARRNGVAYQTAKRDIERLLELDILTTLPDTRPKAYCSRDIFRIAYEDRANQNQ